MSRIFTSEASSHQPMACNLLEATLAQKKLAHAYLLTGRNDNDKWLLAQQLACYLNCRNDKYLDSGSCIVQELPSDKLCQNCRWIMQNAHPQAWLKLTGEETKTGRISVEKARLLSEEFSKTSSFYRVLVIPQAEQAIFHRPSANALLKTIEEPGANILFVLFASHEEAVLPTIVSRCQVIAVPKSQSSGFWLSSELDKPETLTKLTELKSQLKLDDNREYDFTSIYKATSTLASTLAWSAKIEKSSDELFTPSLILDLIVASEFEALKSKALDDSRISSYLQTLLQLSEEAKNQMEHYVQSKSGIEAFALSCYQLCHGKELKMSVTNT